MTKIDALEKYTIDQETKECYHKLLAEKKVLQNLEVSQILKKKFKTKILGQILLVSGNPMLKSM